MTPKAGQMIFLYPDDAFSEWRVVTIDLPERRTFAMGDIVGSAENLNLALQASIVLVRSRTGKLHVLKDRWGPPERRSK